jgi:DNA-directed RNA polymerase specialized sigma24 family protein
LKAHSPRAYATLLLHRCEGWSLQEVADHFAVSYSMARKYLAIALHHLQTQLEKSE